MMQEYGYDARRNAFGNALGNSIVEGMSSKPEQKLPQLTDAEKQKLLDDYGYAFGSTPSDKEITAEDIRRVISDKDKELVFDQALKQKNIDEAVRVADLVDVKRNVDDINGRLAGMSSADLGYELLAKASKVMTASLMNADVYYDQSLVGLLPDGVTRLDDVSLAQLGTILRNKDFVNLKNADH